MNKHNRPSGVIAEQTYTHDFPDLFAIDLVKNILSELSEYERSLLLLAHTKDLNYREIGELVGIAKGTARLHCLQALARAKELLHSKNV
jgi:DNA-directed RNA polymerase specialized sigma24 family protein